MIVKIIKLPDEYDVKLMKREFARKGCDHCPYCGEDKDQTHYRTKDDPFPKRGILEYSNYDYYPIPDIDKKWKLFRFKKYQRVDICECLSCGDQWRSDPYEV